MYHGLGSLTAPQGVDLSSIPYQPDEVSLPLKQAIDRVRPAVAVDLHNWQNKHTDGLLRHYCERNFQATVVTFEFSWFGRTPEDMRATGRQALWALLRAMDPPPESLR